MKSNAFVPMSEPVRLDQKSAPISYGSVCSGIEAATVAMHPFGWQAAWFAEIEPFPCAVLKHHYPDVPNLGDMTKIAGLVRAGSVIAPDVLVGGTPCQAFSVAGLRKGLDDERGQLSISFVDLADAIDSTRTLLGQPSCVVWWENVPGVLSSGDNAFGCFLGALAGDDCEMEPEPRPATGKSSQYWRWKEATSSHSPSWPLAGCVYGPKRAIAWRVLDAQYFGVAQRRRRVFVVASAREGFDPAAVLFEFDGLRRDSAPSREAGQDTAGTLASRTGAGGFPGTDEACSGYLQPVTSTLDASFGRLQGCSGQDANHGHSHLVAVSVALRGREGGATAELGDDLAGCLRASSGGGDKAHVLAPVVSAPVQRSVERPRGDGLDTLIAQAHPPVIAVSSKDYGGDADYELAPTLRAGNHNHSHANGGQPPAIAFDSRQDPVSSTEVFGALGSSSPQAQSVAYAIQAGALRTNPNSGPDGIGVQAEHAYTLEARSEVQAVSYAVRTANTSANGHGISPELAHTLDRAQGQAVCVTGEITHTLKAEGFDASEDGTGRGQPIVAATRDVAGCITSNYGKQLDNSDTSMGPNVAIHGMAVRRLTPRECERLQGFPDDYTLIQVRGKPAADGPRYKALGNSMCVKNMRWIGRRIDLALRLWLAKNLNQILISR